MSAYDDIVSKLPIQQLAEQTGEDPAAVEQAVHSVLPALLGGLHANAQDPGGAAALTQALTHHDNGLTAGSTVDLSQVDTSDGAKIAQHVFGSNTDQVVSQLGTTTGNSALVSKLLPMLAPIVMSYIAKAMAQGGGATASTSAGSGALGTVLSSILGGGAGGSGSGGLGGLGSILGGLLGGGTRH